MNYAIALSLTVLMWATIWRLGNVQYSSQTDANMGNWR